MLTLLEGPAGGGKSQVATELLDAGLIDLLADLTSLWVALTGVVRGPDGRFPERQDDDPALEVARYIQPAIVRFALQLDVNVGVTTSRRGQVQRWQALADDAGVDFDVRTIDPGRSVVEARLSDPDGQLSEQCRKAIARWYD